MGKLLATRHHHFDVERAVFMTVLHRVMVSGSDRIALQWRCDKAIDGAAEQELQHLYRAMGWLGEGDLRETDVDPPGPFARDALELLELLAVKSNLAFSTFWLAPRLGPLLQAHPWLSVNQTEPIWDPQNVEGVPEVEIRFGRPALMPISARRLADERAYPVCAPGSVPSMRDWREQWQ